MRALVLGLLLLLGACATTPAARPDPTGDSLDAIARDYVALILEIGEREPGYVDAYYGPPEWAAAARASPRGVPALIQGAASLTQRLNAVTTAGAEPAIAQRKAYLLAHVSAASARLRMIGGERMSFADEAEALFGVRPEILPLSAYDPILAEIDALVPGEGPLAARVATFRTGFQIPTDRLQAVFDASISACRARTVRHIDLPANERFTLAFVTDKPWSGYNYYQGSAASRIEINTDQPIFTDRAVDLGCHEGYPGHHLYNVLLEERLARGRGWVEFTVYPLYSPQSLLAEGSANYGIELAFPGEERAAFEARVLYPLAGLDPKDAGRYLVLQTAQQALSGARFTIAAEYLAGRMDRATAVGMTQKYGLVSEKRASQTVAFAEQYRSYVINYGLGLKMVRDHVQRAGPGQAERWKAMEAMLSEPSTPADLLN